MNRRSLAFLSLLAAGLIAASGCGTTQVKSTGPFKKVALLLGGGGARGFAEVGVIRELEAAKIPVNLIVGVSVGSLVGALYADNPDSFKLEWKTFQIDKKEIFDFNILNLASGLAQGEAIKAYCDRNISTKYLEDLKIPLAVVATDLKTGTRVVFQKGLIRDAVRASTSVPGVFAPIPSDGKILVDGGVLGNLPVQVAKDLGADFLIAVDIPKGPSSFGDTVPNALTTILESLEIMGEELVRQNVDRYDALIVPNLGDVGILDFTRKKESIEAGRAAALKAIPEIKRRLQLP